MVFGCDLRVLGLGGLVRYRLMVLGWVVWLFGDGFGLCFGYWCALYLVVGGWFLFVCCLCGWVGLMLFGFCLMGWWLF